MTYEEYRKAYFTEPQPAQRFAAKFQGAVLYFRDFEPAVTFYTKVFGPPAYVEGAGTRGWFLGSTTLTLLHGGSGATGAPRNMELSIVAESPAEVNRLYGAFTRAGAAGDAPVDTLMYRPVRYALVADPFGTVITISSPLP